MVQRFLVVMAMVSVGVWAGCASNATDPVVADEPPVGSATATDDEAMDQVVPAMAGLLVVAVDGDDEAAGTAESPLRHIQTALDRVGPGETIKVMPGVYRERLSITRGGEAGKPISVIGSEGVVLDGSNAFDPQWEPAQDIGPGVYVTTIPFEPRSVTVDGLFLTLLAQRRVTEKGASSPAWVWTTIFKEGINSRGQGATWDGVHGLGLYFSDGERFYVRLKDQADPRGSAFVFAPNEPAVNIEGVSHVLFSGFVIRDTPLGVRVAESSDVVIDGCTIGPAREGVGLGVGSRDCVVRYCEVFQNPYSNYLPLENSWETWTAHKRGGYYDMRGIKIERTDGGHEVHDNYIHHHWDGISDMGWLHWRSTAEERLNWAGFNQNLDIHHNRIEDMNDDSLEPNSAEVNNRWHHNLVLRSRCALRVKVVDVGPMYIYNNVFFDNKEDIRFYGELELNPAEVYVYHNTVTSPAAITSNKVRGIGTPNYHVYNNLFYSAKWWHNTGGSVDPNWSGDYNVYARRNESEAWDTTKVLADSLPLDAHSVWVQPQTPPFTSTDPLDFSLTADSPARGAGTNLQAVFGQTLPGLDGEAYQVDRPDAGAVPYGQPTPTIPRPRSKTLQ